MYVCQTSITTVQRRLIEHNNCSSIEKMLLHINTLSQSDYACENCPNLMCDLLFIQPVSIYPLFQLISHCTNCTLIDTMRSFKTCVARLRFAPNMLSHEIKQNVRGAASEIVIMPTSRTECRVDIISAFVLNSECMCSQAEKPTAAWVVAHM